MEDNSRFESVYSTKVRAGRRRTYFFDVRKTKGGDFYVTLTESTKKFNSDGYERHKIFLYKEDFNRFLASLTETINHVKTELMPDYDYEEFERRQEEWEAQKALEDAQSAAEPKATETTSVPAETTPAVDASPEAEVTAEVETTTESSAPEVKKDVSSEDDMAW